MINQISLERMVRRSGGWSLTILIAITQVVALAGAIPGLVSIRVNAEFDEPQLRVFSIAVPLLIVMANLILIAIAWRLTPAARKRLDSWANDATRPKSEDELLAWREITSLSWRYGMAAAIVFMIVIIVPAFLISFTEGEVISSVFQPTALNASDPIYVLVGGLVSLFASVILSMLLIERFTLPIRLLLLPDEFETQLKGHAGLLLNGKFLILTLALTIIAVLLIAPIGYQHTIRVLYAEISSIEIFRSLQLQSVLFSLLALLLGAGFSYYVAKAVSDPIYELIKTFNKIEQGDLTQRALVI